MFVIIVQPENPRKPKLHYQVFAISKFFLLKVVILILREVFSNFKSCNNWNNYLAL